MHGSDGRRRGWLLCILYAVLSLAAAAPAEAAGTATPNDPYFVGHDQWPRAGFPRVVMVEVSPAE